MSILTNIYNEVFDFNVLNAHSILDVCKLRFSNYITSAISNFIVDSSMFDNDLYTLASHINADYDLLIPEQTLVDMHENILLRVNDVVIETPQYFFMRMAMHKYSGSTENIIKAYKHYASTLDISELGDDFVFYGLTDEIKKLNLDNNFDYRPYFSSGIVVK